MTALTSVSIDFPLSASNFVLLIFATCSDWENRTIGRSESATHVQSHLFFVYDCGWTYHSNHSNHSTDLLITTYCDEQKLPTEQWCRPGI